MRQAWEADIGTPAVRPLPKRVPPSSSACRVVGWCFGDELYEQQHVVMAIDVRTPRTFLVEETSETELSITFSPDADLVVMQIDGGTDAAIGRAVGHEQDHSCPLGRPSLDGVGPHTRFELGTVTSTKFEGRKSHSPMKSHHNDLTRRDHKAVGFAHEGCDMKLSPDSGP